MDLFLSNLYPLLKQSHMMFAIISVSGFCLRAYWSFFKPEYLHIKWVRVLPHINDSLLLISAICLAVLLGFSPHNQPWLAGKIILLLFYIALGAITLKPRFDKKYRLIALLLALCTFSSILFMAFSKQGLW